MRIAFIHSYYSKRQHSGENVAVDSQMAALSSAGQDVKSISLSTDDLATSPTYQLRTAFNVAFGTGPSPLDQLAAFEPDVVHVHNLFPNWGTTWLDEWPGPLVTTIHNFRPMCAAGTLFRAGATCTLCPEHSSFNAVRHACYRGSTLATAPIAFRNRGSVTNDKVLRRADRTIFLSPRARDTYTTFGFPPERSVIIPNFAEAPSPQSAAAADGWVYIGRLTPEKGILKLLVNWPQSHRLKIYGDGPLREQVLTLQADNIRYMGEVNHSEIPKVMAAAKGLIFPSEWAEGLPLVYIEALGAGRPVVAKSGNSASDDILTSGAGAVFSSWSGLVAALDSVGNDQGALAQRARSRYEEAYTQDVWLNQTLALYSTLTRNGD